MIFLCFYLQINYDKVSVFCITFWICLKVDITCNDINIRYFFWIESSCKCNTNNYVPFISKTIKLILKTQWISNKFFALKSPSSPLNNWLSSKNDKNTTSPELPKFFLVNLSITLNKSGQKNTNAIKSLLSGNYARMIRRSKLPSKSSTLPENSLSIMEILCLMKTWSSWPRVKKHSFGSILIFLLTVQKFTSLKLKRGKSPSLRDLSTISSSGFKRISSYWMK